MERLLALYDSDAYYATRFMEYFNNKNETDFKVSVFTRKESLEDFLKLHQVEILLLGIQVDLDEQLRKNIRYSYHITDSLPDQTEDSLPQLSKYQSVRTLMNRIIADYQDKENITLGKSYSRQTEILSVFTPVSGIEKLSFAWSLGYLMSEQVKVLFVLLDLLPVTLLSQIDHKNSSLSEFIYYLKENSNIIKMKALIGQSGKLSYLSGIINGSDILSLCREDIQKWIEELRANSDFDTVIFYQGCYTDAMLELMKLSDNVLVATSDNPYETAVLKEWYRQMSHFKMGFQQDKFKFICLKEQEEQGHVPIAMSELMGSSSWQEAKQYIKI